MEKDDIINAKQKNDLDIKWDRARKAIREIGADGCLLTVDMNLYYMTGRIYSGYFYLPAEGDPCCFVKRPNNLQGEQVEYIRKPEQIAEIFASKGIEMPKHLLLESDELPYNEHIRLQSIFNPTKTGNATALMRSLRQIKTPWEIEQLRLSGKKHAEVYALIPSCFKEGMTDLEFQYSIEQKMRAGGSLGIFRAFGINMDIFMGSILAGDNAQAPSPYDFALGGAGMSASCPLGANGTRLEEGISVMVDMAGNYTSYMTDMTRVFSIGKLSDSAYRAHEVALTIQYEIANISRPGTACADIYNLAARITEKEGLSDLFMGRGQQAKFVGHGIGLQVNELPVLTSRSKELLLPNMVFALEPKFVLPGIGAVGIENSFLVTDTGVEKLTLSEESIINLK